MGEQQVDASVHCHCHLVSKCGACRSRRPGAAGQVHKKVGARGQQVQLRRDLHFQPESLVELSDEGLSALIMRAHVEVVHVAEAARGRRNARDLVDDLILHKRRPTLIPWQQVLCNQPHRHILKDADPIPLDIAHSTPEESSAQPARRGDLMPPFGHLGLQPPSDVPSTPGQAQVHEDT